MPDRKTSGSTEALQEALRVFINYRRDDTPGQAGRLYDALTAHFGEQSVFMDVDTIELGADFKDAIEREVGACDVLVALIGRQWLTIADDRGRRRLERPEDYVRLEIEAALERGVRVIPALIEGVQMPTSEELPESLVGLSRRNALEMGDGARWRYDVGRLISALERIRAERVAKTSSLEPAAAGSPPPPPFVPSPAEPTAADGPPPAAPRWFRRPLVLALAAAGVLAAGGAIAAALLLTGGSGSSAASGTPAGEPGGVTHAMGTSDAIVDELLLAHIPRGIRAHCSRIPPVVPGVFVRSVSCAQDAHGDRVTYSRAHSGDALRAYFIGQVNSNGIAVFPQGTCTRGRPAADEWSREGSQTHIEPRSSRLRAEGRVLCFRADADTIMWTDTPTQILGIASRPAGEWRGLYGWWRTEAGPEKERAMAHAMGMPASGPYDAIEKELLLEHIPVPIRKTCRRTELPDDHIFLRAVRCSQGSPGATVTYAYAHSGTALKTYSNDRLQDVGLTSFDTTETCDAQVAATTWVAVGEVGHRESRSRSASGRVICSELEGRSLIEWTDTPTEIYAIAASPTSRSRAQYIWWQRHAGPANLQGHGAMSNGMEH